MPIAIDRRTLQKLIAFAAARGVLAEIEPALCIFQDAEAQETPKSTPLPPQPALRALQSTLSDHVSYATDQANEATKAIINSSYTVSTEVGFEINILGNNLSASGGIVTSYDTKTGSYIAPSGFWNVSSGYSNGTSATAFVGGAFGNGPFSGFGGTSKGGSAGLVNYSGNEAYSQVGLRLGPSLGYATQTYTDKSYTGFVGQEPQPGNVFSDMKVIEDTLWNMSQDPLSGKFR